MSYTYAQGQEVFYWDEKAGWSLATIGTVLPDSLQIKTKSGTELKVAINEKQVLPRNPPELWDVDNLMQHEFLHEASLLETLTIRYNRSCIYTYSGPVLISLNPYRDLGIYGSDTVAKYRGGAGDKGLPHVYAIAQAAYARMMDSRKDQSMLITGESGAGKTEATKLMLNYLALVATPQTETVMSEHMNPLMRMKRVEQQIIDSSPITEAFGNAKTVRNDNSSRFGKFMELQFDNHAQIIGAKIVNYMLEKSRIVGQAIEERNYHIFYMICTGLDASERSQFHLRDISSFTVINKKCLTIPHKNDQEDMAELRAAFSTCGVGMDDQALIFSLVATVLHVGDITFTGDETSNVSNKAASDTAADLLQVDRAAFATAFTTQRVSVAGSVVVKNRTPTQAEYVREALCKGIYARLFDYIIMRLNASVCKDSCVSFIGLLDIFGFEIFQINSFEQFCINYTNEKLQQMFNMHMFTLERAEYETEGVPLALIEFHDNSPCVELFEAKLGMIGMLDEECTVPKATDLTWTSKLYQKFAQHPFFLKPRTSQSAFIVRHFAGEVMYESAGFLDKNMDPLSDDILSVLKTSKHSLLVNIFSDAFAEMDSRAKGGRSKKVSVGSAFRSQLNALSERLGMTESRYVRTIKPNSIKSTNTFDTAMVLRQLQCSGVLEAMRIRRAGFPVRRPFAEFLERYRIVKPTTKSPTPAEKCIEVLKAANIPETIEGKQQYTTGKTKVFLREKPYSMLEAARERALGVSAVKIQSKYRSYRLRKRFLALRQGARHLQAKIRRIRPFNKYMGSRLEAKYLLAKYLKGAAYRSILRTMKRIGQVIQRSAVRNRYQKMWRCAQIIQLATRQHSSRRQLHVVRVKKLGEAEARRMAEEEKKKREEAERKRQEELKRIKEEEERIQREIEEKKRQAMEEEKRRKEEEERKKQEELELRRLKKASQLAAQKKAELEEEALVSESGEAGLERAIRHKKIVRLAAFREMATPLNAMPERIAEADPIKKGTMSKQGGGWRSWKARYFVLQNNRLTYYASPKDAKEKGEIILDDAAVALADKEVSKNWAIKITTTGRAYFLCCDSQADRQDWINHILASILYHLAKADLVPRDVSTEETATLFPNHAGWLIKESGKNKSEGTGKLERRWFAMREASLFYFKSPTDSFHRGVISLLDAEIARIDDAATGKCGIRVTTPVRVFVLHCKSPEERDEWIGDLEKAVRVARRLKIIDERVGAEVKSAEGEGSMEGFLHKRGSANTAWKKRWFSLSGGKLCYFANHKDVKPLGVVMLDSKCSLMRTDDEDGRWCVTLITPARHYILRADTDGEIQKWQTAFRYYVSNNALTALAEKRGTVFITEAEGTRRWREAFLTLKDVTLFVSKKKESGVPLLTLKLRDCKVRTFSAQDAVRKNIFEIDDKTMSFLISCDSDEEKLNWMARIAEHKERAEEEDELAPILKTAIDGKVATDGRREKEGEMGKMGPKGDWQTRYCVLVGLTLHYYKKQMDLVPAGSISLEDAAVSRADARVGVRNCLEIFSAQRNYFFALSSQQEASDWEDAIRAVQERVLQCHMYLVEQEDNPAIPRRVVLSVSEDGLQVMRLGDEGVTTRVLSAAKRDGEKQVISFFPLQDIFSWNSTQSTFSVHINSTKKKYVYRTTTGAKIAASMQKVAIKMFEAASRRH